MFIGRSEQIKKIESLYKNNKSCLGVVYGRRRVGKSELLKTVGSNKLFLYFEGIEGGSTQDQIQFFHKKMIEYFPSENLHLYQFKNWNDLFNIFTQVLKTTTRKPFIVFDEFQWMAAKQSKLVATIKIYWDQYWKKQNVMLILCGSVAHYMTVKVIKSKALYGRIDYSLQLAPLEMSEAVKFFIKINDLEIIKYFLILGTIPKYLELVNPKRSFDENMLDLFFVKESYFLEEIDKVFYSQFKEAKNYRLIIEKLIKQPQTQEEIAAILKMKSGGGVKTYISNLLSANFIVEVRNLAMTSKKGTKYRVADEYLIFYFKYLSKHISNIKSGYGKNIYNEEVKSSWLPWLGLAFEALCIKKAPYIAKCLGLDSKVLSHGSFYVNKKGAQNNVQIDLVYVLTNQRCVVFEIKFNKSKIEKNVVFEMESKIEKIKEHPLFKDKTIERGLIHIGEIDKLVLQMDYFNYTLDLKTLIHSKM